MLHFHASWQEKIKAFLFSEGIEVEIGLKTLNPYRIYSSERPGRPFNFGFSNGGAYLRDALFRGRFSLNI